MTSRTAGGNARFAGLSSQEVDRLLAQGDGDAALCYMYIRRNALSWLDEMPGLSAPRLHAALRRLCDAGLLTNPNAYTDSRTDEARPQRLPSEAALTRPAFTMVLGEAERLLGRVLSPQDMKILYDMFDWRGLPPGVIMLLLHYCVDDTRRRLGENARPPGIRQIDREAAIWQREGLMSEEQAEAYIRRQEQSRGLTAQSYKALGVFGRPPSESEKKYVQSWIEMGFGPDVIAIAYDITVLQTGKLAWKYCDSILRRWHDEKLHTRAEVEARETRGKRGAQKNAQASPSQQSAPRGDTSGGVGLAQTRKALERVREHARKSAGGEG